METVNGMTPAQLRALPVAVPLVIAAKALNMGRTKAYDLARQGQFPIQVIPCGPKYVVPRSALLKVLGIEDESTAPRPESPRPAA